MLPVCRWSQACDGSRIPCLGLPPALNRNVIQVHTNALKLYPTDAWALKNRGLVWKEMGEMGKAEVDWKRAKEIEPGVEVPEQDSLDNLCTLSGLEFDVPPPHPCRR